MLVQLSKVLIHFGSMQTPFHVLTRAELRLVAYPSGIQIAFHIIVAASFQANLMVAKLPGISN